jgi:hypothetical protein
MTRHPTYAGLTLLVAVTLGACSSSKSSSSTTAATSPPAAAATTTAAPVATTAKAPALTACELVTKEQAQTVVGLTLQAGVPGGVAGQGSCMYTADPNGPVGQFEVYVGDGAKTYYDDDNDVLHHTFTDVPGLGDESHEEDFNIFFRKGTTWVALRLTVLDDYSKFKPAMEALAHEVAAKV